jgi:hypothetical protein
MFNTRYPSFLPGPSAKPQFTPKVGAPRFGTSMSEAYKDLDPDSWFVDKRKEYFEETVTSYSNPLVKDVLEAETRIRHQVQALADLLENNPVVSQALLQEVRAMRGADGPLPLSADPSWKETFTLRRITAPGTPPHSYLLEYTPTFSHTDRLGRVQIPFQVQQAAPPHHPERVVLPKPVEPATHPPYLQLLPFADPEKPARHGLMVRLGEASDGTTVFRTGSIADATLVSPFDSVLSAPLLLGDCLATLRTLLPAEEPDTKKADANTSAPGGKPSEENNTPD